MGSSSQRLPGVAVGLFTTFSSFKSSVLAKLAEVKPDDREGRTYAEVIAANLVDIACSEGHGAVTAAAEIANRLEGRATQRLDVNNITADLANRSDEELRYHLLHDHWPEDADLPGPIGPENGREK